MSEKKPVISIGAVNVDELQYKLMPQSEEHLKRFPGDRHTEEQRVAFDAKVRELVKTMPEVVARRQAAHEVFPPKLKPAA